VSASLPVEDDRTAEFVEFTRTRDPALRDALIAAYLPLAQRLARHFVHRGEAYDDLVQAGTIGLIKAVDRFDPERGVNFSSYATKMIVGELKRHFRDRGWSVRPPRRIQELHLHLGAVVGELTQRLHHSPTIAELARETGASEEDVLEALEAGQGYHSLSLDAPTERGDGYDERLRAEDVGLESAELRILLDPALASLSEREQLIVRLRFEKSMTQSEIAELVGVSQMHVSRILSRCIAKLHSSLSRPDPPDAGTDRS
jgi:RNA polymerase sigma-B factor